jgi:hypothetical protein
MNAYRLPRFPRPLLLPRVRKLFRGFCALAWLTLGIAGCSGSFSPDSSDAGAPADAAAVIAKSAVINEVFPHGANALTDPDWVELKNIGAAAIDLSGYRVRDSKTTITLPQGTHIAPGGYLVIYCDDVPDGGASDRLHAPFKLGGQDEIYLLDPVGNRIDSVVWDSVAAPSGRSYGRLPDGTGLFLSLTPTRNARNI